MKRLLLTFVFCLSALLLHSKKYDSGKGIYSPLEYPLLQALYGKMVKNLPAASFSKKNRWRSRRK